MRIALIQQHASPDNAVNLDRGLKALEDAAAQGARLACYAELAFERFFPQYPAQGRPVDRAESIDGPTTRAFQQKAKELGVVVVLNLYEREGSCAYDCSPVIDADGTLLTDSSTR